MRFVGKLNKEIFRCISEEIRTDEVIITEERVQHIRDRHPDYIIKDKQLNTGLVIKRIISEATYVQLVLRICTSKDDLEHKNSIISLWEISEKRLQNYLRNKSILYKKL